MASNVFFRFIFIQILYCKGFFSKQAVQRPISHREGLLEKQGLASSLMRIYQVNSHRISYFIFSGILQLFTKYNFWSIFWLQFQPLKRPIERSEVTCLVRPFKGDPNSSSCYRKSSIAILQSLQHPCTMQINKIVKMVVAPCTVSNCHIASNKRYRWKQ